MSSVTIVEATGSFVFSILCPFILESWPLPNNDVTAGHADPASAPFDRP